MSSAFNIFSKFREFSATRPEADLTRCGQADHLPMNLKMLRLIFNNLRI